MANQNQTGRHLDAVASHPKSEERTGWKATMSCSRS